MPTPTLSPNTTIPLIDLTDCGASHERRLEAAFAMHRACRDFGFFYVSGHGISETLISRLAQLAEDFFAMDLAQKIAIRMELGGLAWRGYFPVGGELTAGIPDLKEGLYFGSELEPTHPLVQRGTPLHGPNLFPPIPGFRETVLHYIEAVTQLGHLLMQILALSLGLAEDYFRDRYTRDPFILFRIFHYPPDPSPKTSRTWGVGEHTDYGLLTILKQDDCGGLEVKSQGRWIDAPPIPGTFVCNIGDMLDRMTGGLYLSTPHRVRNISGRHRYSFPLFFDPAFASIVEPIFSQRPIFDNQTERWDQASVHQVQGTYGDYLIKKVSKVFPQLAQAQLAKTRS